VCLPCLVKLVKVDVASPVLVEEAEDDFVFGVGFCEEVLEDGPVVYADPAFPVSVGYREEDAVLVTLDFVLDRSAPLASLDTVQHLCLHSLHSRAQPHR
jgi:hypothetical protein